jgi:hypothetical protein
MASARTRPDNEVFKPDQTCYQRGVKLFFTGPVIKTDLLVLMLERHGIAAVQEFTDASLPEDGDLDREARVLVPDADFDRAHQLFFAEREDEF